MMTELCEFMASPESWPSWYQRGDAVMKRSKENCDTPLSGEPSMKIRRYHELENQGQGAPRVNSDDEDDERTNNRRCAGTQTSFSSFPPEQYTHAPPSDYRLLNLDRLPNSAPQFSSLKNSPHLGGALRLSPPPYPMSTSPSSLSRSPPSNGHSPVHLASDDSNSTPLNLTTNQQLRPSVITCTSSAYVNNRRSSSPPRGRQSPDSYRSQRREIKTIVQVSTDPAIEEHFRRSLGKKYAGLYGSDHSSSPGQSPTPLAPQPPSARTPPPHSASPPAYQPQTPPLPSSDKSGNLSIAGSVDDHFAKSLGAKWKQMNSEPEASDVFPDSVDDHFAKALGPAWLRIKAEKEGSDYSCPSTPSPTHSNGHTSMVMS